MSIQRNDLRYRRIIAMQDTHLTTRESLLREAYKCYLVDSGKMSGKVSEDREWLLSFDYKTLLFLCLSKEMICAIEESSQCKIPISPPRMASC
jgi:hypothetical protein